MKEYDWISQALKGKYVNPQYVNDHSRAGRRKEIPICEEMCYFEIFFHSDEEQKRNISKFFTKVNGPRCCSRTKGLGNLGVPSSLAGRLPRSQARSWQKTREDSVRNLLGFGWKLKWNHLH